MEAKAIGKMEQEKLPTEDYSDIFVEIVTTGFPKGSLAYLKLPIFST